MVKTRSSQPACRPHTPRRSTRVLHDTNGTAQSLSGRQETCRKRTPEGDGFCNKEAPAQDQARGLRQGRMHHCNQAAKSQNSRPLSVGMGYNKENVQPVTVAGPKNEWTMDQEMALQNAYFLVRPSPTFWVEISKKVPGKTAKECFDRFYSAHPTPPAASHLQKHVAESPIRSISFSSPMSALKSRHNIGRGKQRFLQAQKTVRHIFRKQQVTDGGYEADVFAAVEGSDPTSSTTVQLCPNLLTSPLLALGGREIHTESSIATPILSSKLFCTEERDHEVLWKSISTKKKKRCSVLDQCQHSNKGSVQDQIFSPEVLKRESNPGRLDRYLDMLHLRRIDKQKSSCRRGRAQCQASKKKSSSTKPMSEKSLTQMSIPAAKNTIIADAKEMLKTLLCQPASEGEVASPLSDTAEEESSLISDE